MLHHFFARPPVSALAYVQLSAWPLTDHCLIWPTLDYLLTNVRRPARPALFPLPPAGMFELNNLAVFVASPLQRWLHLLDSLAPQEQAEAYALAGGQPA